MNLTDNDRRMLAALVTLDRARRDDPENNPPLSPGQQQLYDLLMKKAGQQDLPLCDCVSLSGRMHSTDCKNPVGPTRRP